MGHYDNCGPTTEDDLRHYIDRLRKRIKALEVDRRAAQNLLAVLHGDGGHHEDRVGHVQACKDAEAWRHRMVLRLGALERVAEAARRFRKEALPLSAMWRALDALDALEGE